MVIDEAAQPSGWALPRLPGRWVIVLGVAAVLALGAALSVMLWRDTDQRARRDEQEVEQRVGDRLAAEVRVLTSGLAGASNVLDDAGRPDRARFDRLANELFVSSVVTRLSFSPVQRTVPNGLRVPIRWIQPATPELRRVVGYDLAADPERAVAVRQAIGSDDVVFTPPVHSLTDGSVSFVLLAGVRDDAGRVVGLLGSGVSGSDLFSLAASFVPRGTAVSVSDAGDVLFGSDLGDGTAVQVSAGGRRWRVDALPPSPDHDAAIVTMILSAVLAVTVGWSLVRQRRQARELDAAARGVRLLGRLSEQLASAHTIQELVSIASGSAAPPVSADVALVALVPSFHGEPWLPACVDGIGLHDVELVLRAAEMGLGGADVVVRRKARTRRRPAVRRAMSRALHDDEGAVIGALAWGWRSRRALPARARSTSEAMRVLWENHLVRVRVEVSSARRAAALSQLGRALSIARDVAGIADAVVRHGAAASGYDAVALGTLVDGASAMRMVYGPDPTTDERAVLEIPAMPDGPLLRVLSAGDELVFESPEALAAAPALRHLHGRARAVRAVPLRDSTQQLVGVAAFIVTTDRTLGDVGNLRSIADLVAQTLERAQMFEAQRALVTHVQHRTLSPIPGVEGLEIAARYAPSAHRVGVGGDWYDVGVDSAGQCVLVVGDVAGHGIEAVMDMVEVSAIVSALARGSTCVAEVADRAYRLLEPTPLETMRMATVVVARLDPVVGRFEYVLLGHPPPLLRHPDGRVELLSGPVLPPIGCAAEWVEQTERKLEPGSSLLLYTDGLVERHGERFDDGLDRLRVAFGEAGLAASADGELERVMAAMRVQDDAMDDVSALVVRFG